MDLTAVGAVGELELLGQECRGSLLGMSHIEEEGTLVYSGQLCCGSEDFIPVKTKNNTTCFNWNPASHPEIAPQVTLHSFVSLFVLSRAAYLLSG